MIEHILTCAQLEKRPCPASTSLHGEPLDQHWWSGWPGAFCLKCGAEDKDEICIGAICKCPCHDKFWKSYEESCAKDPEIFCPKCGASFIVSQETLEHCFGELVCPKGCKND